METDEMINLLKETLEILHENGKSEQDVRWVGIPKVGSMSWEEFKQLADEYYDNDFGIENVNPKLVVVGDDWWLERHSYDGAEWWEFKMLPKKPPYRKFKQYRGEDLEDLLYIFEFEEEQTMQIQKNTKKEMQ